MRAPKRCSFCRKKRDLLIASPDGKAICDVCVLNASAKLAEEEAAEAAAAVPPRVIDFAAAREKILNREKTDGQDREG